MTDKQIMIDGVDVSGCCCIENGYCLWIKKYYEKTITFVEKIGKIIAVIMKLED